MICKEVQAKEKMGSRFCHQPEYRLLKDILTNVKKVNTEDYKQTADKLEDGLNKMVKECTMIGSDHEALHE